MTTDIIIVSYKDEEPLKNCINSIKKNCIDYTLIIEDNNINNIGFSAAVNAGIKKGNADFIWLLNSDVIIMNKDTQQALINRFSYGKQVGIVGSMQRDASSINYDRISHSGTIQAFPNGIHSGGLYSMGHGRFPSKQKWVNFASVMIRRTILPQVGLLDESMYLLYSDSSYCYSCRKANYEVWYEPKSQVLHSLGISRTLTEWHRKDMMAFMKKWGIEQLPDGNFKYSELFAKLNLFP